MEFTYAVVVVSDTCFIDKSLDKSGTRLSERVIMTFPKSTFDELVIVPDEIDEIASALLRLSARRIDLILTSGGTGVAKRDVTPEATKMVVDKEIPGIPQTMLIKSLNVTDMAMISRAIAGIRGSTLIINLPGSVNGALECFEFVKSVIPHSIQLIRDDREDIKTAHETMQRTSSCHGHQKHSMKICRSSQVRTDQVAMRKRESPYDMIAVDEAHRLIESICKSIEAIDEINIEDSLNRVLAEDVRSQQPHPPFKASQKDGYAVNHEDGAGVRLVKDFMAAGDTPKKAIVDRGEAIRISTGAPVPDGATAVVEVEATELVEADKKGNEVKIRILSTPQKGLDIREIGSDIQAGEVIFNVGDIISPAHIGVMASLGKMTIKVYRRASVGILSTGKELCPYNVPILPPGHIRDSNKLTLINIMRKYGFEATDLGIVKDSPDDLVEAFAKAFQDHDAIITSGGVSMGEFDFVKDVLKKDFNSDIHFGRVNMRPGKPTTFASCLYNNQKKYVFALPGNPVSATVTCYLFAVPAMHRIESRKFQFLMSKANFTEEIHLDPRPEYMRVTLSKNGSATIAHRTGTQVSSKLNSCAGAHALALLPAKTSLKSKISTIDEINIILLEPHLTSDISLS